MGLSGHLSRESERLLGSTQTSFALRVYKLSIRQALPAPDSPASQTLRFSICPSAAREVLPLLTLQLNEQSRLSAQCPEAHLLCTDLRLRPSLPEGLPSGTPPVRKEGGVGELGVSGVQVQDPAGQQRIFGLSPVLASGTPASPGSRWGLPATCSRLRAGLVTILFFQEDDEKLIEEIQKEAEEEQKRKNGGKCPFPPTHRPAPSRSPLLAPPQGPRRSPGQGPPRECSPSGVCRCTACPASCGKGRRSLRTVLASP